jgi:hypothetical protein
VSLALSSGSLPGSGSFSNLGGCTGVGVRPVLVNAPDFWMNSERAAMPSLV